MQGKAVRDLNESESGKSVYKNLYHKRILKAISTAFPWNENENESESGKSVYEYLVQKQNIEVFPNAFLRPLALAKPRGVFSALRKLYHGVLPLPPPYIFRRYCPPTSNSAAVICPNEQTLLASIKASNRFSFLIATS